jgi:glycosyltransferase involved in cell wall biosynthesis
VVVLIAGREVEHAGDGHTLYVRAHAGAAAGLPPHLFSVVSPAELATTDVGPLAPDGVTLALDVAPGTALTLAGERQTSVPLHAPHLARAADVFVLPSLGEGSGSLALVEALRAGRPVVASACDGIPEDVTDGESALLVKPRRVDELAAALARLLTDGAPRRHLARGARAALAARFSPEDFVEALRATYAGLGVAPSAAA